MIRSPLSVTLDSPGATARLARRLGALLHPGDCLLLDGPIGAGKTHFARALIQPLLEVPEDIPSPTFTLVQTYETSAGALWHADLYRLSAPEEIEELGLAEAMEQAICVIEWPEKLGPLTPQDALHITFQADATDENRRHLSLSWSAPRWAGVLDQLDDTPDD
ncbi:MAG: tRNA (adenosine(37)-N6)-threonylcarbamoyltransferase complex ATPase subunit type 1 TsaE [Antarcticimicrobium sp.]|uniref:tRNA (adenosine(37)-N6)-threonylcarbamoyltransferase complex ATPase subunit type 1 TsaE n=1 Tax=Antarcticimicrobium sp. TaxID=2824147 RepID=UPI002638504C|nr:tRNA (adenosine(37)-N6)-threonylcarbamoyltransferase complex ATPase subunit type 1 TsaE [Antarcticimicrobium sp.]MDF1716574.1 tRNA (adenosine(37)-N6)-threonylcarbamoyltransferase complex ATPase subunit type 1 TsaE [Antarcticimicrobium sp.]